MFNPKIIAGCGVAGFLLSFIAGLLGDVSFGAVMLRALLSGIGTGAIGVGVLFVLHTFLPEMWEKTDGDTAADESAFQSSGLQSGGAVDITVEDDQLGSDRGGVNFFIHPESRTASGSEAPVGTKDSSGVKAPDIAGTEQKKPSFVPQSLTNTVASSASVPSANVVSGSAPADPAVADSSVGVAPVVSAGTTAGVSSSGGIPDLDSLPDMGDIVSIGKEKSVEGSVTSDIFSGAESSGVSSGDVSVMARAISSMLAKSS